MVSEMAEIMHHSVNVAISPISVTKISNNSINPIQNVSGGSDESEVDV